MLKARAAAMSAAAVIGFAVIASAQVPAKPDSTLRRGDRQGQVGAREGRGGHGRGEFSRRAMHRGGRGMRGGEGRFMRDLNLTDAQKTRIKSIHEKYRPQFESLRKQAQPQFQAMRDARQKRDTSAATRARFRTQMEQFRARSQAIRLQEQNEVRAVLTADQRAKWDAAQKKRQDRQAQMKKRFDERRGQRQGRSKA
jgi:Spy/CpxP family protein refolding chaperone